MSTQILMQFGVRTKPRGLANVVLMMFMRATLMQGANATQRACEPAGNLPGTLLVSGNATQRACEPAGNLPGTLLVSARPTQRACEPAGELRKNTPYRAVRTQWRNVQLS